MAKKITFESIVNKDGYVWVDKVANCCGIASYEGLDDDTTPKEQAQILATQLHHGNTNQIVFTDTCSKTGRSNGYWNAAKRLAHKGPVTKNPNSGNYVRHYTITRDQIVKLYKSKK